MDNGSETLMLSGVLSLCPDCGGNRVFVPVEDGRSPDGRQGDSCEFCCTSCDSAVFLLPVFDNTGSSHRRVA